MLNTLKELCLLNGVSGNEDEVRGYLTRRALECSAEPRMDRIGNLIVFKKGRKSTGNRLMLCAHMDEVGIIVPASQTRASSNSTLWVGWTAGWPSASRW